MKYSNFLKLKLVLLRHLYCFLYLFTYFYDLFCLIHLKDLYRKVLSVLNKITPQKFQTLTKQILELEIDTPERLEGVIDRIFEKVRSSIILCRLVTFLSFQIHFPF